MFFLDEETTLMSTDGGWILGHGVESWGEEGVILWYCSRVKGRVGHDGADER